MTLDVIKFAKVMELTRSPADGERLAALSRAASMLEAAGLTWTQFLTTPAARFQRHDAPTWRRPAAYAEPRPQPARPQAENDAVARMFEQVTVRRAASAILRSPAFATLEPHEQDFVASVPTWKGPLSEKQVAWMERLISKIQAAAYMNQEATP